MTNIIEMSSIFTKIVQGDIPAYKIYEDENFFVFLDAFPLAKGHTLVIPKQEIDYLFDLPDTLYSDMQMLAKKVAVALKQAVPCKRIGVAVLGLEVPHAHIHLVPMNSEADINFKNPKLTFTPEQFEAIRWSVVDKLQ